MECYIDMGTDAQIRVKRIRVCLVLLVLGVYGWSLAQDYAFVTLNTVKARFMGMGGACVSVTDDLAALDCNPAGFQVHTSQDFSIGLFNNYIGMAAYLAQDQKGEDFLEPFGFVFKGITITKGRLSLGILLSEEALGDESRLRRKKLFDLNGFTTQRSNTVGFSFVLAPRVSLGAASELYVRGTEDNLEYRWGYRYGLIVKPKESISIGICYFDLPEAYPNARQTLEGFSDESLNVGISYQPFDAMQLAVDIRSVTDEGRSTTREPHIGFELLPIRQVALRTGCYFPHDDVVHYSVGFSMLDWNTVLPKSRQFDHSTFALNAAFVWRDKSTWQQGYFFLGGLIHF